MATRGPEIESWFGVENGVDLAADNDWPFLPFMALSDGAHAYVFKLLNEILFQQLNNDSC